MESYSVNKAVTIITCRSKCSKVLISNDNDLPTQRTDSNFAKYKPCKLSVSLHIFPNTTPTHTVY